MRLIPESDLPLSRQNLVNMLAHSPDPYLSVIYKIELTLLKDLIDKLRKETGKRITLTHAINKIVALIIDENRAFNRVVLDSKIYELEDIHITNIFMLPGDEKALTVFTVENPHQKSLQQIQEEFETLKALKYKEYQEKSRDIISFISKVFAKTKLYKLIREKRAFKIAYERNITSNIGMTNLGFKGSTSFLLVKPAIFFMRAILRIHMHGSLNDIEFRGDKIVKREIMPITLTADHRIIDGYHLNQFGDALARIASHPEEYLV